MADRVFAALDVTKTHTHALDAFDSPGLGPLGVIDDGRVIFRRALPTATTVLIAARRSPRRWTSCTRSPVPIPGLLDASRVTARES